jgi:allophanate hydrolase subunit 2
VLTEYNEAKDVFELRVVLGPQDDHVKDDSIATFLNSIYHTSIHCNRVGYRFEGPQLFFKERQKAKEAGSDPSNIVDDGNSIGAIQIPGGKEAICLGPDGVSMGGYVKIACLIKADMDKMAQIPTKAAVRFKNVTVEEAKQILIQSLERINENNIYSAV